MNRFVNNILIFSSFTLILLSGVLIETSAQNNKDVRISPKAIVEQTVGHTDITIEYSRPGVKERKIWGGLVPFNVVWRAGANEATKFTLETDVKINGRNLKAGSYSFFAIPTKNKWTLIFNNVAEQWGAFEYNDTEDALRFEVEPETDDDCWQEWLAYTITKTSDNTAVVRLEWEKLKVPFTVEVAL